MYQLPSKSDKQRRHNTHRVAYDGAGRLASRTAFKDSHAYASTYGYAPGHTTMYSAKSVSSLISSITQTGHNLAYTYDDNGNISSVTYNTGTTPATAKTTYYVYDGLGQLRRVND